MALLERKDGSEKMKKYTGKIWNVVTPLSLTLMALGAASVTFMDGLKHGGRLSWCGWLTAIVALLASLSFKIIWAAIQFDDEKEYRRIEIAPLKRG